MCRCMDPFLSFITSDQKQPTAQAECPGRPGHTGQAHGCLCSDATFFGSCPKMEKLPLVHRNKTKRSCADGNRNRWIQGPECWPLHHRTTVIKLFKFGYSNSKPGARLAASSPPGLNIWTFVGGDPVPRPCRNNGGGVMWTHPRVDSNWRPSASGAGVPATGLRMCTRPCHVLSCDFAKKDPPPHPPLPQGLPHAGRM